MLRRWSTSGLYLIIYLQDTEIILFIIIKINLHKEWIMKLNEVIEELLLGYSQLDEVVDRTAQRMDKPEDKLNKINTTNNDIKNLLELIRRAREDREWKIDGLTFENINIETVLGGIGIGKLSSNETNYSEFNEVI